MLWSAQKAIFISTLAGGGAEKVVVNLSKNFDYIILLNSKISFYDFQKEKLINLNSWVTLTPPKTFLGKLKKVWTFFVDFYKVRITKKRYNISLCLSFLEYPNLLNVLTKRKGELCVISIRSIYSVHNKHRLEDVGIWDKIMKLIYVSIAPKIYIKRADLVIVNSKGIKIDLIRNFNFPESKIITIHNPINFEEIQQRKVELLKEYEPIFNNRVLITVGRLTKPKGHWYLIRVFRVLKEEFSNLKLLILGLGELKDYLVDLSKKMGLKTYIWDQGNLLDDYDVYFIGFQTNPFKFIARSELFLFPSLWEGFPNALLEAMACGVPIVSSDCKSGPREILAPETNFEYQADKPEFAQYGILMPPFEIKFKRANEPLEEKEKIWVEVISKLLKDKELRKFYAKMSIERAKEFDMKIIMKKWETALKICEI